MPLAVKAGAFLGFDDVVDQGVGLVGHEDAAGVGLRFEAGGKVHPRRR